MGAREVLAGKAVVEVGTRLAIARGLKAAEVQFKKFGATVGKIGNAVALGGAAAAGGASAIAAPLIAAALDFANFGSELDDMSQRTGVGADRLSELAHAAKMSGTDLATVEGGIKKTQKAITEAAAGNKTARATFRELGLSAEQLQYMAPDDQFYAIANALKDIPDPSVRAAKAMEVFGKSGTDLLPLMISDIDELKQEARDLGLTMSNDDASAAAALGDAIDKAGGVGRAAWMRVGAAITPMLIRALELGTGVAAIINKWVDKNRILVVGIAATAAILGVVGSLLIGGGLAISIIGTAIATLGAALGWLGGVAAALSGPMLIVAGVLATAGVAAYIFRERLIALLMPLLPMFNGLKSTVFSLGSIFMQTFGGIVAALSSGNLAQAGQIALAGLTAAFWTGVAGIGTAVTQLLDLLTGWLPGLDTVRNYVGDSFRSMGEAILAGRWDLAGGIMLAKLQLLFASTIGNLSSIWRAFSIGFMTVWDSVTAAAQNVWRSMVYAIADSMLWLVDKLLAGLRAIGGETLQKILPDFDLEGTRKQLEQMQSDAQRTQDKGYAARDRQRYAEAQVAADAQKAKEDGLRAKIADLEAQSAAAFAGAGSPTLDAKAAEARKALEDAVTAAKQPPKETPEIKALGEAVGGAGREVKLSSVGTFSAAAVGLIGGGTDERVATNTSQTVQILRRIAKQRQRGPAYS